MYPIRNLLSPFGTSNIFASHLAKRPEPLDNLLPAARHQWRWRKKQGPLAIDAEQLYQADALITLLLMYICGENDNTDFHWRIVLSGDDMSAIDSDWTVDLESKRFFQRTHARSSHQLLMSASFRHFGFLLLLTALPVLLDQA
jgi:hypothetical protein